LTIRVDNYTHLNYPGNDDVHDGKQIHLRIHYGYRHGPPWDYSVKSWIGVGEKVVFKLETDRDPKGLVGTLIFQRGSPISSVFGEWPLWYFEDWRRLPLYKKFLGEEVVLLTVHAGSEHTIGSVSRKEWWH
jgi:hypothetical protein